MAMRRATRTFPDIQSFAEVYHGDLRNGFLVLPAEAVTDEPANPLKLDLKLPVVGRVGPITAQVMSRTPEGGLALRLPELQLEAGKGIASLWAAIDEVSRRPDASVSAETYQKRGEASASSHTARAASVAAASGETAESAAAAHKVAAAARDGSLKGSRQAASSRRRVNPSAQASKAALGAQPTDASRLPVASVETDSAQSRSDASSSVEKLPVSMVFSKPWRWSGGGIGIFASASPAAPNSRSRSRTEFSTSAGERRRIPVRPATSGAFGTLTATRGGASTWMTDGHAAVQKSQAAAVEPNARFMTMRSTPQGGPHRSRQPTLADQASAADGDRSHIGAAQGCPSWPDRARNNAHVEKTKRDVITKPRSRH